MMKRLFTIVIFTICLQPLSAQQFSLTSRFKFWLLNNEARMLSVISFDRQITSKIEKPFALLPRYHDNINISVERILGLNRKFYAFLDEIDHAYQLALRFGNGRLAVLLKKARPAAWSLLPFTQTCPWLGKHLQETYRKAFYATFIKSLGLNQEQDKNVSARLQKATNKLSTEEARLLNSYLNNFSALFPGDQSPKMIWAFVESAGKQNFARGIAWLLEPDTAFAAIQNSEAELGDPLAELEKLAAMSEGDIQINMSAPSIPAATAEDYPEPEEYEDEKQPEQQPVQEQEELPAEDMFNIWD